MSKYTDENYSDDYVEGDTPSEVATCDLTAIMNELTTVKAQNVALNTKLDTLLSAINSNKTLSFAINDKLVSLDAEISNITQLDISNLVTQEYIDSKVPFVDDKSLAIYPKDTKVTVAIAEGIFNVESSKFLPNGDYNYTVVYTLSKEINGVKKYSDFASSYVLDVDPEVWILKSDCPENSGG
ncbi:MAG: hypothetical protein ACJAWW_001613 [Sulfurimonas sp.]|jgi:hypothetical protein